MSFNIDVKKSTKPVDKNISTGPTAVQSILIARATAYFEKNPDAFDRLVNIIENNDILSTRQILFALNTWSRTHKIMIPINGKLTHLFTWQKNNIKVIGKRCFSLHDKGILVTIKISSRDKVLISSVGSIICLQSLLVSGIYDFLVLDQNKKSILTAIRAESRGIRKTNRGKYVSMLSNGKKSMIRSNPCDISFGSRARKNGN